MTHATTTPRLDRLETYLRQDPDNPALLADAFDAALQSGEWARAEFHLRHAQALGHDAVAWRLRESHWLMAQSRWPEADASLRVLASLPLIPSELSQVLAQDLAQVALMQGDCATGFAHLAPWVELVAASAPLDASTQVLWLRLQHHMRRLDPAFAWATARWKAQQLSPAAAGVASLIALDVNQAPSSLAWAEHALQHDPGQTEALVTRATLALGQTDPVLARRLLTQALERNANDGRTLSALGFTELLEMRFDAARDCLGRAVQSMPGHIGTWHGLAWSLIMLGDLAGAQQAFEQALALDRNFAESHGGLAVVLAMRNQRAEAEQSIERAMRLDRGGVSAHYAQAVLRGEARDARVVQRLAKRLLGDRPTPLGGSVLDAVARAAPGLMAEHPEPMADKGGE